jgi:hypothetical protein
MNLNNIKEHIQYKNYKELCIKLDEPIKSGKAKKLQLEDWKRYFKYERKGQSFIILEIYPEPKPKEDKRQETVYGQYIEKLILDLLVYEQEHNNKYLINLGTNKLFEALNMINKNYSYCLENKQKLSTYLEIDKEYIKDFYNNTHSKLIQTLEGALKRLTNKMLIHWNKVITICVTEFVIKDGIIIKSYDEHYIASDKQTIYVLNTEKQIAEEMEFKTVKEIILRDKFNDFNKRVIDKLQENEEYQNLRYYNRSYKIFFNDYIRKEQKELELLLKEEERRYIQKGLNNTIIEKYKKDNEKRYQKHLEDNPYIGEPKYKSEKIKISEDYIKNNNLLVDTVINADKENIIPDIIEKSTNKKT